jgi:hypothetical protein
MDCFTRSIESHMKQLRHRPFLCPATAFEVSLELLCVHAGWHIRRAARAQYRKEVLLLPYLIE